MSSSPTPSSASSVFLPPSPRVQSANSKTNEEFSKDSIDTITTSVELSRPASAQKSTINSTDVEILPDTHIVSNEESRSLTATSNERPTSASKQSVVTTIAVETTRPSSAIKTESILASTTISSRPTSASQSQELDIKHNSMIDSTNIRPTSANNKTEDLTTRTISAASKGSRPPSAITTLSTSRPSSAQKKLEESITNNTATVIKDGTSTAMNLNDLNTTQPVTGRPSSSSSAAKKSSVDGLTTIITAIPLHSITLNDNNQISNSTEPLPTTSQDNPT